MSGPAGVGGPGGPCEPGYISTIRLATFHIPQVEFARGGPGVTVRYREQWLDGSCERPNASYLSTTAAQFDGRGRVQVTYAEHPGATPVPASPQQIEELMYALPAAESQATTSAERSSLLRLREALQGLLNAGAASEQTPAPRPSSDGAANSVQLPEAQRRRR